MSAGPTPRERYPEIWAATFGAAWVALPEEHRGVSRARLAGSIADNACQSWHEAEEARWRDIEAADVAKRGPTEPPHER